MSHADKELQTYRVIILKIREIVDTSNEWACSCCSSDERVKENTGKVKKLLDEAEKLLAQRERGLK